MNFWTGKRVVIGISGGIAAYRTLDLIRRLREEGAIVPAVVVTAAALRFVTSLSLQALAGSPVHDDLFSLTGEREMGHIRLAREADLILVAPVTADLLAKLAGGHADDLLTTLLLARKGPVLLAPSMNSAMWEHPATQRNAARVQADGISLVGPESGWLACGEIGVGRMAPVESVLEEARRCLTSPRLTGLHLLVTAGPTREELDPVRYLTNHSSGRMGWAVAMAAARHGAMVTLIHGPVSLPPPPGVTAIPVVTAEEMLAQCLRVWPGCHAAVMTAAVVDFRPNHRQEGKIKKEEQGRAMTMELIRNPDILAALVAGKEPGQVVVGFAAETGEAAIKARAKLARKGCDLLVANDLLDTASGFGVTTNQVTLVQPDREPEAWPIMSKEAVGERLVLRIGTMTGHCQA